MSEMVERVAKAICEWQEPGAWERALALSPLSSEPHAAHYRKIARAAIAAMREPTEAMLSAPEMRG